MGRFFVCRPPKLRDRSDSCAWSVKNFTVGTLHGRYSKSLVLLKGEGKAYVHIR